MKFWIHFAWLLLEPGPSLHNKYTSDTAYHQQVIVSFAQPAIDKRLLGAVHSHQSDVFDWLSISAKCRFDEVDSAIKNANIVAKTPCTAF